MDSTKGTTTQIFNKYVTNSYFFPAIDSLFRISGHKSSLILQLMSEWSFLNYAGYRYKFLPTPNCPVCSVPETTQHYLLHCPVFAMPRQKLQDSLQSHNLSLTLFHLFGLTKLTQKQLQHILLSLYDYISKI